MLKIEILFSLFKFQLKMISKNSESLRNRTKEKISATNKVAKISPELSNIKRKFVFQKHYNIYN